MAAQNIFKLKETGDIFTIKNGRPLLLQLGSLASSVPGANFSEKLGSIKGVLNQYGINYDSIPEMSVEDAARKINPNAHPNSFFDLAQTGTIRDIAQGGEQIRTLNQPELNQAERQRKLDISSQDLLARGNEIGSAASRFSGIPFEPTQTSSLSPQDQDVLSQAQQFLDNQLAQGNMLNPNVQITHEKLKEFETLASQQIDPYYATQLKLATDTFLNTVGFSKEQLLQQEQIAQQKYGIQLRQTGEQAAEQGFAQSGRRIRSEQELARDTQQGINQARSQFGFQAGNLARTLGQQYGGTAVTTPTLLEAPQVIPGETSFSQGTRQLPLYNLSPEVYSGLVGEQQFAQEAAKQGRVRELITEERTKRALPL